MADGHIVYQGPAVESANYFGMFNNAKTKYQNPCDYFMRVLSVNYPKTEEDEARMGYFISLYKEKCEPYVLQEIDK